jgi:hypothetical protein
MRIGTSNVDGVNGRLAHGAGDRNGCSTGRQRATFGSAETLRGYAMFPRSLVAVVLGVALSNCAASAAVLTFNYVAAVSDVDGAPGVSVGDIVTGQFTYDTNSFDISPDPNVGIYILPDSGAISASSGTFARSYTNTLGTARNTEPGDLLGDEFQFGGTNPLDEFLILRLEDTQSIALTSDALPASFDLSLFERQELEFVASIDDRWLATISQITLAPAAIPEPWSAAVLALGLGALILRRSR